MGATRTDQYACQHVTAESARVLARDICVHEGCKFCKHAARQVYDERAPYIRNTCERCGSTWDVKALLTAVFLRHVREKKR